MKTNALLTLSLLLCALSATAQDIALPTPDTSEPSMSVVEALRTRHSVREFAEKDLTAQQLANLCWAACGPTRDEQHITAPSAMNRQEVRLYAFTKDGAYEYLPRENRLALRASGDHRPEVAGRQVSVATAPVILVMVADLDKFGATDATAQKWAAVDTGIVSQNINLYCQAVGLATVPRGTMDTQAISATLALGPNQLPMLNNPVGFAK